MTIRQRALIPRSRAQWLTLALTIALAAAAAGCGSGLRRPGRARPEPADVGHVRRARRDVRHRRAMPMFIEFRKQARTITLSGPAPRARNAAGSCSGRRVRTTDRCRRGAGPSAQVAPKLFYNVVVVRVRSCARDRTRAPAGAPAGVARPPHRAGRARRHGLVDQFISVLVLLMIHIHNGPVSMRDAVRRLAPSLMMTGVGITIAVGGP